MKRTGTSHSMLLVFLLLFMGMNLHAQDTRSLASDDSTLISKKPVAPAPATKKDTSQVRTPRQAAIRSAIFPGLGQIYNHKIWKVPIVWGALGTTAGIFFYNLKNYKDAKFAYRVKYNMRANHTDSALYPSINPKLKLLSEESLRYYRNQFRRDIDYSALFFVILWGLNVVDATVDAHLKTFDVSPDLSLKFKVGHSELANTNGVSILLKFRSNRAK